jgi:hypothetical protein
VQPRFERYGFAFLVLGALACASYLAGSAVVPEPVPDYALQAEEIYRLEIGAAFFVAFYLVTMALLLALHGRGFAEFGARGLKATTVVAQQESSARQKKIDRQVFEKLNSHDQRLARLESKR